MHGVQTRFVDAVQAVVWYVVPSTQVAQEEQVESAVPVHPLDRYNPVPQTTHGVQTRFVPEVHAVASYVDPVTQEAAHVVQVVAPLAEKEPPPHAVQLVPMNPLTDWKLPAGQSVHMPVFGSMNCPDGHVNVVTVYVHEKPVDATTVEPSVVHMNRMPRGAAAALQATLLPLYLGPVRRPVFAAARSA